MSIYTTVPPKKETIFINLAAHCVVRNAPARHSVVFFATPPSQHITMSADQQPTSASDAPQLVILTPQHQPLQNTLGDISSTEAAALGDSACTFISADCEDAHSMMQAYLQKPTMHKAVRIPSPVPGLMMVIGTHLLDGVERRRLFLVMMNQVPGKVAILPPHKKMKRRALMFGGIMPAKYMQNDNEKLCIVNLADLNVLGSRHKWPAFDAPMCRADGTAMSAAELRTHTTKSKDGKKRRPITIMNNVLVTDQCTWFLMSLAGQFRTVSEYRGEEAPLSPSLEEYDMTTLPFARLQTAVTVVRRNPTVPSAAATNGDGSTTGALTVAKPNDGLVSCSVSAMMIDVPQELAITALEYGAQEKECPEFCTDVLRCLVMDAVGLYVPQPLDFALVGMHRRLAAKRLAEQARDAAVPEDTLQTGKDGSGDGK